MRIRRGDSVQIMTGDDAGTTPRRVIQVLDGGQKLLVEGVNQVHKHVRRGHPKSPQGGRLELELPIDSSNVLLYCDACGRGTRVGFRRTEEGSKERFCKKCGKASGIISPAKTKREQA